MRSPIPAPASRPAASQKRPEASKPTDADSLYREGRRYADQEKFEQALALYNQAIQLNPSFTLAFNARCYAHLRLRQYDQAIADCNQAIKLNPAYGNAYRNRAVARQRAGDRAGANEDFRRADGLEHVAQVQPPKLPAKR